MTEYVHVLTHVEMGWDCVCGVFESLDGALRHVYEDDQEGMTTEELEARFDEEHSCYVIHTKRLEA